MFSSTYSSNPFPYFLPSSYPSPLPPFLSHENTSSAENTFLHDPLSLPFIPSNNSVSAQIPDIMANLAASDYSAMVNKQDFTNGDHYGISSLITKKPAKKDRHSKIYTSQGLRDRRVRLSIEIARKFFDLQDMLGFDKASNTLEWLFTKSKKAIKELALSKKSSRGFAKSISSSSECEVVSEINQDHTDIILSLQGEDLSEKIVGGTTERKLKQMEAAGVRVKKESREKARARARERTNHKMCNTNDSGTVQELKNKGSEAENRQSLNPLRSPMEGEEVSGRSPNNKLVQVQQPHPHHLVGSETSGDHNANVIEESILIKRKLKPSLMSSNHQNFSIPKEGSFNHHESNLFHNFPQNWDANGSIGRSSFCAMASMNLSTELQIFGKPWEECNNQRLH